MLEAIQEAANRVQSATDELQRNRAELDKLIRAAKTDRYSLREIAAASGLSHQTVANIIRSQS